LPRAFLISDSDPAEVVVVRLDWDGRQKTWLLTAVEKRRWRGGSGDGARMDTAIVTGRDE